MSWWPRSDDLDYQVNGHFEYLLAQGADLASISRISVALDRPVDVVDRLDRCAWTNHTCTEDGCCAEVPEPGIMRIYARLGWVYALVEESGFVAYIGMTGGRLPDRMEQHEAGRWPMSGKVAAPWRRASLLKLEPDFVVGWNVGDAASRLEKALILLLQPPMNTAGLR